MSFPIISEAEIWRGLLINSITEKQEDTLSILPSAQASSFTAVPHLYFKVQQHLPAYESSTIS